MKHYLGDRNMILVKNSDNLVYKVNEYETWRDTNYISWTLELVAGWDYIDPDTVTGQGWCPANRFIEDVQEERVSQYFLQESLMSALESEDFTVLNEIEVNSVKLAIGGYNNE